MATRLDAARCVVVAMCVTFVCVGSMPTLSLKQTISGSMGFKCKVPQPRSIHVYDLVKETQSKTITPNYVVLHRCDIHSGCCTKGVDYSCGPVAEETVRIDLYVVEQLIDHTQKQYIHQEEVRNHTQCGCDKVSRLRHRHRIGDNLLEKLLLV